MPSSAPRGPADPWHTPPGSSQPPAAAPAYAAVAPALADQAAAAPGYAAAGYPVIPAQAGPFVQGRDGSWQVVAPPPPTSLGGLGTATVVLLALQVVLGIVTAGVAAWGVLSWSRISGAPITMALPPDAAQAILVLVRFPLGALTGVLFVCWLFAATKNARNAGARVRHSPGWAIFSWIVPVLNLWRPKQMVDDVWRASMPGVSPGTDLRHVAKPSLVTWWWAAYLIGTTLPAIGIMRSLTGPILVASLQGRPAPVEVDYARVHETAALWNLWGAVVLVLAAGLALVIVRRISGWQDDKTAYDAELARAAWSGATP